MEGLGITANITDNEGINPIHYLAYSNKDLAIFDYFIEKGVDVNASDKGGNTALMNASNRNDLAVVQYLAEKSDDINRVNNEGKSALTNTLQRNSPEVVGFLIGKGADITIVDKDRNNLAYYLINAYSNRDKEVINKKWDLLTKKGLDLTHIQKGNNTIYHLAATKNSIDLLDKIAKLNIDINAKNENGLTDLHRAAMTSNNAEIIKHLIDLGAKPIILSDFEESAYDLALENELLDKSKVEFLKI